MIHLVGLVFSGGLGIPLYENEKIFHDEPVELIWAVSSAIQSFVQDSLGSIYHGEGKKSSSDLKSGNIRLLSYDPFVDLELVPKELDLYTINALQDRWDNIELTNNKLREIHNLILPLGLDKKNASYAFRLTKEIKEEIKKIVLRTQELSTVVQNNLHKLIVDKLKNFSTMGFIPLKISIADVDNGLVLTETSKHLFEDPSFTDLILSNIVSENPADSKSVWIERDAPLWIETGNTKEKFKEVFTLDHIGQNSDFRLLTRICFLPSKRNELNEILASFACELFEIITKGFKDN